MDISDKNILLIAPRYFNYEMEIKNEIEQFGGIVDYFDERPKNDFFTKVFIRLNFKILIKKMIDRHYSDILNKTKNKYYDYILLVNPETITDKHLLEFRQSHDNVIVIVYMWDSVSNKKQSLNLLPHADKFMTFDPDDFSLDHKIEFLPLFYINSYKELTSTSPAKYDILFVGTIHSDRYDVLQKVKSFANKNDLQIYIYLYSPSIILFTLTKLLFKQAMKIKYRDISFHPIDKNQMLNLISASKVIIDIEHPKQNGLTMRCIEMVGAKKKLITTNRQISKYDFYHKNNILSIDRKNVNFDMGFFDNPYHAIDGITYAKYSLPEWIKSVFSLPE